MLGIYIHLPFCTAHCAYCPFVVSTDLRLQDAYIDTLLREIELRATGDAVVDTLFFGGGTPSRTSPEHLRRIVDAVHENFALRRDAEFSLEANPEDVTPQSIEFWRSLGVNRLSIGVQSLQDSELQAIGRIHDAARARQAVSDAVSSAVRSSVDLIIGLPRQTADSFRRTLREVIDSGLGHVSVYMLDLDEETALKGRVEAGVVRLPDEELVASLYLEAVETLGQAGFAQYEISNFARPAEESRHNLRYWRRERYLGFGAGAHSFIGERRFANARDVRRYIEGPREPEFAEALSEEDARRETLFLQMRQSAGIDYGEVLRLCGEEVVPWIENGMREGWLRRDGSHVAFTPAGFLVSSELISQLF